MAKSLPAPGWYTDPGDPARRRWWDGVNWTDDSEPHLIHDSLTDDLLGAAPAQQEVTEYPTQVFGPEPPVEVTPVSPGPPLVPVAGAAAPGPENGWVPLRHRATIRWARFVATVLTLLGIAALVAGVGEAIFLLVQANVVAASLPGAWVSASRELAYQYAFASVAAGVVGGVVLMGLASLIKLHAITAEQLERR